jgi:hypothetical protein
MKMRGPEPERAPHVANLNRGCRSGPDAGCLENNRRRAAAHGIRNETVTVGLLTRYGEKNFTGFERSGIVAESVYFLMEIALGFFSRVNGKEFSDLHQR